MAEERVVVIDTAGIDCNKPIKHDRKGGWRVGTDNGFFPLEVIAFQKGWAHVHLLPAKILRLVIAQIIFYGEFRVKTSMSKKVVLCFKKAVALPEKQEVLLWQLKAVLTFIGFESGVSAISEP